MNCVAFWTLETFAVQLMVRWVSDLLGGQIVPLDLLPRRAAEDRAGAAVRGDLLDAAADLPRNDPARGYASAFAVQLGWFVAFAGLSAVVWRAAQRRVVVQGG